eukprot:scaffold81813_cov28-Tisochrysis_lutea.AAC.2
MAPPLAVLVTEGPGGREVRVTARSADTSTAGKANGGGRETGSRRSPPRPPCQDIVRMALASTAMLRQLCSSSQHAC